VARVKLVVSVVSESTDDNVPITVDGETFSVIVFEVRPISVGASLTLVTLNVKALAKLFAPSLTLM
jgi:hypothetical protein